MTSYKKERQFICDFEATFHGAKECLSTRQQCIHQNQTFTVVFLSMDQCLPKLKKLYCSSPKNLFRLTCFRNRCSHQKHGSRKTLSRQFSTSIPCQRYLKVAQKITLFRVPYCTFSCQTVFITSHTVQDLKAPIFPGRVL